MTASGGTEGCAGTQGVNRGHKMNEFVHHIWSLVLRIPSLFRLTTTVNFQ